MKTFKHAVAKIKNSDGEFEGIPALTGESMYDIAVRYGYVGTEEDLIQEILESGWVATCAKLTEEKADITYVDEEIAKLSNAHAWKQIGYGKGTGTVNGEVLTITLDKDLKNYNEYYIIYGGNITETAPRTSFWFTSNDKTIYIAYDYAVTSGVYVSTSLGTIFIGSDVTLGQPGGSMDTVSLDTELIELKAKNYAGLEVKVIAR